MTKMKSQFLILLILILFYSCEKKYQDLALVELDKKELLIKVNEESTLTIEKYYPEKPKDLSIDWYSTDTNTVIVDNGVITGVAPGEASVYAMVNEVQSFSCHITVKGVYDKDNDVYILGNYDKKLMYWKNGIPNQVTEAKHRIVGKAIQVVGDDIYVAADDYTVDGFPIAKYWINGEEFVLSEQKSGVTDMAIHNNTVYVTGYEVDSTGLHIATYWENGVATYIDSGGSISIANAITIHEGDVYIAGFKADYNNGDNEIAKYWKNGEEFEITRNTTAFASDIFIKDNKVYTLVNESVNNVVLARYWEDKNEHILSENKTASLGLSMTIADGTVYVSGMVFGNDDATRYATLWVDGIEKRLSEYNMYGETCKIISSNGDVYVLTNERQEYLSVPKYWKNGKETRFEDYYEVSMANDIFVVPKN